MIIHSKAASDYFNAIRKTSMEDLYVSQLRRIALFKAKMYMIKKEKEKVSVKGDG